MRAVKSAERVMMLFEYFSLIRRPAPASEIQEALKLPQSSTSVLLRFLIDLGYLEYIRTGRMYQPTARVAIFSDWLKPFVSENLFCARLDELRDITRETVVVGSRNGDQIDFIHIVLSNQDVQFYMQEGTRRNLCISASGRILLSLLYDEENVRLAKIYNGRQGAGGKPISIRELLSSIADIRDTGLSETIETFDGERDIHAVAMLIPASENGVQYSVTVVGPKARMLQRRKDIIEAMHEWLITSPNLHAPAEVSSSYLGGQPTSS
jgi:DNA-binding IclR family transcriptional regulator